MNVRVLPVHGEGGAVVAHAMVDAADYGSASSFHWRLHYKGHAVAQTGGRRHRRSVYLHRLVMGLERGDKCWADHINRNPLDCRRANLRPTTRTESPQNTGGQPRCRQSRYRGVTWNRAAQKWSAQVKKDGRHIHLGLYQSELDAATAAAKWRHLNFPLAVEDPVLLARPQVAPWRRVGGVSRNKYNGRWRAYIYVGPRGRGLKRQVYLGTFGTEAEAREAVATVRGRGIS